jgi:tRNA(Ile)-lysidine synthase TilS/MesJ
MGDKILIGTFRWQRLFGLVELLAKRAVSLSPDSPCCRSCGYENIPYQSDLAYLREYVESWNIPFVLYETGFDASTDTRKSPCFLCSWNRRKALFTVAKEQGCNKIALGHHMDDILETLLMNITFQGAFSSMPPRLVMKKFDMTIIRPMCLVHESDLLELAQIRGYRKQVKNCPYEAQSIEAI